MSLKLLFYKGNINGQLAQEEIETSNIPIKTNLLNYTIKSASCG
jgi:hypothetical protein